MGESFAVNVSTKLDNKLANDAGKLKKKTKKPKPKIARGSQQPKTASSQHASFSSDTYKGGPSSGWPLQPPLFLPVSSTNCICPPRERMCLGKVAKAEGKHGTGCNTES